LTAFGSPDSFIIDPKVYVSKFNPTYQIFGTATTPAAETKSVGLPAKAQLSWFLDHHLNSFIMTGQLSSIYQDFVIS
jgi:hypothetical protein